MINVNQITSQLAQMPDQALQKYAMMNKNDPYTVSLALSEANRRKAMRAGAFRMPGQQPKVVDQDIAEMSGVDPMGNVTGVLPENIGIGRLPAPNMQRMADGGIVGYSGSEGSVTRLSGTDLFDRALDIEGITDPLRRAFAKAIHAQESSGRASAPTSNRGARGPMQVRGPAWKDVATPDMDPKSDFDNMRAGIRYAMKGFEASGGNPVLAGAHYYGGPGGMKKLMEGVSVSDPENPNAPTTAGYGSSVAKRMLSFLPVGSTEAADVQKIVETTPTPSAPTAKEVKKEDARLAAEIPMAGIIGAGGAGSSLPILEAFKPTFKPGTTLGEALTRTGIASAVPFATALGGAKASSTAAKNLKLMSPEQRQAIADNPMLSAMSGDTGLAGAIMNAGESNEPPPSTPYGKQMSEVGSFLGDVALGRKGRGIGALLGNGPKETETTPALPDATSKQIPDELKRIEAAQRSAAEDVTVAPPPAPTTTAAESKTTAGGLSSLFKDPAFYMAMRLLANKNPNLLGAVGEAGIGTVSDVAAAEKAASESEYRKALGKYYGSYAEAIERGAKEKNEIQLAEKAAQDAVDTWAKNNKMALLQSPGLYDEMRNKYRMEAYNAYGIKMPTMSASAPAPTGGGYKFLGVRPS